MGRIENYDNDSGISSLDRLFGTSYEGMLDGRPVYKTKNYLMGEVISKITSEVASAGDRYSVLSYRFTPQMIYDLGDADSGVLNLDPSSSGTNKHWILLPGVTDKIICLSRVVFYMKKGSIPYNANYLFSLAKYNAGFTGNPSNIQYEWYIYTNNAYEESFYRNTGSPAGEYDHVVGKPFMLRVQNSTMMTEGDSEIGIWIEYKYLDVNLDFNG